MRPYPFNPYRGNWIGWALGLIVLAAIGRAVWERGGRMMVRLGDYVQVGDTVWHGRVIAISEPDVLIKWSEWSMAIGWSSDPNDMTRCHMTDLLPRGDGLWFVEHHNTERLPSPPASQNEG